MESIESIKSHYGFVQQDAHNLKSLCSTMERYRQDFVEAFYEYVKEFEHTSRFLKDEQTIRRHQDAIGHWFMALFSGEYGHDYFRELERVGMAHVKINLPAHYVNAAMHFVKRYIDDILDREVKDPQELTHLKRSVDKILDINLDVFTSSYIEEEKRVIFLSQKVETYLVGFARRFSYGLNLVLVLGLVFLGILVMGLFAYDLTHVFEGDIEKGLLATLGSLLMLWVVIELMDTEVQHLRGKKFAIKVFISVALVAVIRKILITTLSTETAIGKQLSLVFAVAVLGVIYWLIARVED